MSNSQVFSLKRLHFQRKYIGSHWFRFGPVPVLNVQWKISYNRIRIDHESTKLSMTLSIILYVIFSVFWTKEHWRFKARRDFYAFGTFRENRSNELPWWRTELKSVHKIIFPCVNSTSIVFAHQEYFHSRLHRTCNGLLKHTSLSALSKHLCFISQLYDAVSPASQLQVGSGR